MNPSADKKAALLALLERGLTMVHLDARRGGVQLPARLMQDPHVRLNLSWRFAAADMVVDDDGIRATLHFGGVSSLVVLPWPAVFALSSHVSAEGTVWEEDVPDEVRRALSRQAQKRPRLEAVPEIEDTLPPPPPVRPALVSRGHLKLVK